jgi:signal transduction histidine kinase
MDGEKNRFVHALRNPLNTISINAELGKLTLERTGDIRKAISIFDTILVECQQCGHVLESLQDTRFTHVNSGGSESDEQ